MGVMLVVMAGSGFGGRKEWGWAECRTGEEVVMGRRTV